MCDLAVTPPPDATWAYGGPTTPAAGTAVPGAGFAPVSGHPVPYGVPVPVPVLTPPKSKAAAAVLCFFLGSLGIHRFYTGQVGLGLAILLTSLILGPLTCGIWYAVTFVWVLVDFVLILTGSVDDQWGRPLV